MVKDDLFVKLHGQSPSLQKILHYHFRLRISLPDQAAHKAVGAGIGPIRLVQPAFQKTGNRPGIINVRQQAPLHIRIGLEGGIEKTADELRQLFPISVCVGFLQRRVVLVQENQGFFSMVLIQIVSHILDGRRGGSIVHICPDKIKGRAVNGI